MGGLSGREPAAREYRNMITDKCFMSSNSWYVSWQMDVLCQKGACTGSPRRNEYGRGTDDRNTGSVHAGCGEARFARDRKEEQQEGPK